MGAGELPKETTVSAAPGALVEVAALAPDTATAALAASSRPAAPPALPRPTSAVAHFKVGASQLLPYAQYQLTRLGLAGQVGLVALTAAAVVAVSALLPAQHSLQSMTDQLTNIRHAPAALAPDQPVPRLIATLPTRVQMSAVIGQIAAEAKSAGVSLDTGRYVYTPAKGGEIARYELEFPVKAAYPDIRTFIDRTLTTVPAAALSKLRVERKAVGDAVVNADVGFVVFVRSEPPP
jgi:hypothetical protein